MYIWGCPVCLLWKLVPTRVPGKNVTATSVDYYFFCGGLGGGAPQDHWGVRGAEPSSYAQGLGGGSPPSCGGSGGRQPPRKTNPNDHRHDHYIQSNPKPTHAHPKPQPTKCGDFLSLGARPLCRSLNQTNGKLSDTHIHTYAHTYTYIHAYRHTCRHRHIDT